MGNFWWVLISLQQSMLIVAFCPCILPVLIISCLEKIVSVSKMIQRAEKGRKGPQNVRVSYFCLQIFMCWHCSAHYPIIEPNSNFLSPLHLVMLERYVDIQLSPSLTRVWKAFSFLLMEDGSQVNFFFNSWDAHCFYAPSILKSYLTVSIGSTYESCIPSDINHTGTLSRVNPMRRALNRARCSVFPVDTSGSIYCFQRDWFTQQWCSEENNWYACNFKLMS